jgi:CheY-like chemotaxis protein
MSGRLKIVESPQPLESLSGNLAKGTDRRKSKRSMVEVRARICGGVGTVQGFEEIVTCLDISKDGLRIPTSRPGYFAGQKLQVTCPFWEAPTAINTPRNAKVVRCKPAKLGFEVALQFLPDVVAEAPLFAQASSPFVSQVRVLVVESDHRAASELRELLEEDGYLVATVEKPEHALAIIQTEALHVIVAEAEGHEMSGHDLCAIVKTSPRLQHIPVILLTTLALPSDYASSQFVGAIIRMTKPYDLERVRRAVHLVAPPPSQSSAYSAF